MHLRKDIDGMTTLDAIKGINVNTFSDFALPEALNHTLAHMNFATPTPIQAQAIPLALDGRDILASAQTGTGKTAAFGIPLVAHILNNDDTKALVLTPTRELAAQVMTQIQAMLGKRSKTKTALLIGGEAMPKQFKQLRDNPRIIVGTPGRINDHLDRKSLKIGDTSFLVLDETDRMLDMGFTVQIEKIMSFMETKPQMLHFSATLPKNIVKLSEKYLDNPSRIVIDAKATMAKNIKHDVLKVSESEKYGRLLKELEVRQGSIILFVKTKFGTEKMAKKLRDLGHSADAIHGDLKQNKRDRVIANFRNEKFRILVATDVAARGLDIPHIEHVINFDLPQAAEDYVHRIGRTARAGAEGQAIAFVSPSDSAKWRAIERIIDPDAKPEKREPRREGQNRRKPFRGKSGRGKPNDGENRAPKHRNQKNQNSKNQRRFGKKSKPKAA